MSQRLHNRLDEVFARCKSENRAALVGYLVAGDPDVATSLAALKSLAEQADVIEIGIPFSDPMADGPVIQAAAERALRAGTRLADVLNICAELRSAFPQLGIILMGYANMAYVHGFDVFAQRVAAAGADGLLLVDIPPEESAELDLALAASKLHNIRLLSPTSGSDRLPVVCNAASGFIYYVSLTGITGGEIADFAALESQVAEVRRYSSLPLCVGFGIKSPEQAARVARFADGVVIGSHFVQQVAARVAQPDTIADAIHDIAAPIKVAIDQGRRH